MVDTVAKFARRWAIFSALALLTGVGIAAGVLWIASPVCAHDWYPPRCCSGADCRPIRMDDVELRPNGFFVKESGELIPYTDVRIRKTPPEGGAHYHRCSVGGTPMGTTMCIYIPNWTG